MREGIVEGVLVGILDDADEARTEAGEGVGVMVVPAVATPMLPGIPVDDEDDDDDDDECCSVLLVLSVSSTFLAGIEASFCRLLYIEGLLCARPQLWVLSR